MESENREYVEISNENDEDINLLKPKGLKDEGSELPLDENTKENVDNDNSSEDIKLTKLLEREEIGEFSLCKTTENAVQFKEEDSVPVSKNQILERDDQRQENILLENNVNEDKKSISEVDNKIISNSTLIFDEGNQESSPHDRDYVDETVKTIEASTQIDAENDDEYSRDLPPELRLKAMTEYITTAREEAQTFVLIQVKREKSHDGKSEKEQVHFRMEADLNPEWIIQQEELKRQAEETIRKELESTSWPKYTRGQSRLPKKRFTYTAPNKVLEAVKQKYNVPKEEDKNTNKKVLKPVLKNLEAVQQSKIKKLGTEVSFKNAPMKSGVKSQIKYSSKMKPKPVAVKLKTDLKKGPKADIKQGVSTQAKIQKTNVKPASKIVPKTGNKIAASISGVQNKKQMPSSTVKNAIKTGTKVISKTPVTKMQNKPVSKGITEKIQKMTSKVPDKVPAKGVSGAKPAISSKAHAKSGGQVKKTGVTDVESGKAAAKPSAQVTSKAKVRDGIETTTNKTKLAPTSQSKINKPTVHTKSKPPDLKRNNVKEKPAITTEKKKIPPKVVTKILPKQTIKPNKKQEKIVVKKETLKNALKAPVKPAPTKQPTKPPAKVEPPKNKRNKREENVKPKLEPKKSDSKNKANVAPAKNVTKSIIVKQSAPKEGPKRPIEKKQDKIISKQSVENVTVKNKIKTLKKQNVKNTDDRSKTLKLQIKSDNKNIIEVNELEIMNDNAVQLEKSADKKNVTGTSDTQEISSIVTHSIPEEIIHGEVELDESSPADKPPETELTESTSTKDIAEPESESPVQPQTSGEVGETLMELESNQSMIIPVQEQERESTTSVQEEENITPLQEEEGTTSALMKDSSPEPAVIELEIHEPKVEPSVEVAEPQNDTATPLSDNLTLIEKTTEIDEDNLKAEENISPVRNKTSPPRQKKVKFDIFDHILSQVLSKTAEKEENKAVEKEEDKTAEKEEDKKPESPKPHICNKCGYKVTEYIEKETEVIDETLKIQENEEIEIKGPEPETCAVCDLTIIKEIPSPSECINCRGVLGKNTKFELLFDVITKRFITTCSICKSLLGVVQKTRRQPLTPLAPSRGEVSSAFAEMVRRWEPSTLENARDGVVLYNLSDYYTTSYADEFQTLSSGPPIRPPTPASFPKRPRFLHKPAHVQDFKPPPPDYKLDVFHGRRKFSGLGYVR